MELILCLLPVRLPDSSLYCTWETDGGFIPQPHHTHRLLMIHPFLTIQSLCCTRQAQYRVQSWEEVAGPSSSSPYRVFTAGDSQAAFRAPEQPTELFNLLCGAGKLIIVCSNMPVANHSHLLGTRVSRRHLHNTGLPCICPSHSPAGVCVPGLAGALLAELKRSPGTAKTNAQGTTRQHVPLCTRLYTSK